MTQQRLVSESRRRAFPLKWPVGAALRRAWANGYGPAELRADILAGLVVGVVALPLSMALAVGVGVAPQHGLYTAIVAGIVVALTGGSKFQITGPTAAFIVILAPIASRHGLSGLLTAGMLAGIVLIAMSLGGFGRLIQFIPHPVTTGFTAGIAAVIALLQLKDACGLPITSLPEGTLEKVRAFWQARHQASGHEIGVALTTLTLLIGLPRWLPSLTRRVPAPLLALTAAAVGCVALQHVIPGFSIATIGSRFQVMIDGELVMGIPPTLPELRLPWGETGFSLELLRELAGPACAIAALGAIE